MRLVVTPEQRQKTAMVTLVSLCHRESTPEVAMRGPEASTVRDAVARKLRSSCSGRRGICVHRILRSFLGGGDPVVSVFSRPDLDFPPCTGLLCRAAEHSLVEDSKTRVERVTCLERWEAGRIFVRGRRAGANHHRLTNPTSLPTPMPTARRPPRLLLTRHAQRVLIMKS